MQNAQLVTIGQYYLALQDLPISNPDPISKRQFIQKKIHDRINTRDLTGPELANRALIAKEMAEQQQQQPTKRGKVRATTPE